MGRKININIIQNIFIGFSIFFISFLALFVLNEYYYNPEYSNTDRKYLDDLSERTKYFGFNSLFYQSK